jgi:hypothetical protein
LLHIASEILRNSSNVKKRKKDKDVLFNISCSYSITAFPLLCFWANKLYELLALCDALRVGRAREKKMAEEELKKRILK